MGSLTSSLGYDLQVLGQGPVPYRGEGQDSDVVRLVGGQALDGDEVCTANYLLLPLGKYAQAHTHTNAHTRALRREHAQTNSSTKPRGMGNYSHYRMLKYCFNEI